MGAAVPSELGGGAGAGDGPGGGGRTHPAVWRDVREKVSLHNKILLGNGEPSKGLVVRVDRLDDLATSIRKAAWLIGTCLLGLFVTSLWALIAR